MGHDKCATCIEHVRKFNDRSCNKKRNSKLKKDEQTSMKGGISLEFITTIMNKTIF